MSEQVMPSSHETIDQPEAFLRLHDTVRLSFADPERPEASLLEQREAFWNIIANAHNTTRSERLRSIITNYGKTVDYMWFGGHDDPLPAGCMYADSGYNAWEIVEIQPDPHALPREAYMDITESLKDRGLGELLETRSQYYEQNKPQVTDALITLSATFNTSKWIRAFAMDPQAIRQALTPNELAAYEATIRQNAYRKIGPASYSPGLLHHEAARYANRRMLHPETELGSMRKSGSGHALQRFQQQVHADIERLGDGPPAGTASVAWDHEGGVMNYYNAEGEFLDFEELHEVAYQAMHERWLSHGSVHRYMEMAVMANGYDAAVAGVATHDQLVQTALDLTAQEYIRLIGNAFQLEHADFTEPLSLLKHIPPDAEPEFVLGVWSQAKVPPLRVEGFKEPRTAYSTKEGTEAEQAQTIGTVELYRRQAVAPGRLVQGAYADLSLPEWASADLIMTLENITHDPEIGGFELVAANRDAKRYYLAYQEDLDPHQEHTALLSVSERLQLASVYSRIGLESLADDLRRPLQLTVSEMVRLVTSYMHYSYRDPAAPEPSAEFDTLESFGELVEDGRLKGGCLIHNKFGKLSLATVAPFLSTKIVDGHVLKDGNARIDGVGHVMVHAIDQVTGKPYMFDFTGNEQGVRSSSAAARPWQAGPAVEYTEEMIAVGRKWQEQRYEALKSELARLLTRGPRQPARPMEAIEARVERLTGQLLTQLAVVLLPQAQEAPEYITPNLVLAEIKKLGRNHPATITVSALLRVNDALAAARPPESPEYQELQDVSEALLYLNAQDTVPKPWDKELIATLAQTAAPIARAIKAQHGQGVKKG